MSLVHHIPDIEVVPCLGCDELIAEPELFRFEHHEYPSCCFWHPYHFWCIRLALPAPSELGHCAECGGPFPERTVDAIAIWGMTLRRRVHRRTITVTPPKDVVRDEPENAIARPDLGVRLVAVWWPGHVDRSTRKTTPHGVPLTPRQAIERDFELAHDVCPTADPWPARLRADPDDLELRIVYADYLEEAGDLERANFVRQVIRLRGTTPSHAKVLRDHLWETRQRFPGSWVRDVARGS